MTPRRPRVGDLATKRKRISLLVQELGQKENNSQATLRQKVDVLVRLFRELRDYGASLITSYGAARNTLSRIVIYLRHHVGVIINGEELGAVSGISEWARRIRQLRVEHGYNIISGVGIDREEMPEYANLRVDQYILMEPDPNELVACRWQVANEIRKRPGDGRDRMLAYLQANVGNPVTGDELHYVAKIKSWARRVRELRTELGWPIYTKLTGAPDLRPEEYLLASLNQERAHDRTITHETRKEVLNRDNYTCTDCGWNYQLYLTSGKNPATHRYLELHHIQAHVEKGSNEPENLITLCNQCHDKVHAENP